MHNTIHQIIAAPLNVGWKVLTALTVLSVLDMSQNLAPRHSEWVDVNSDAVGNWPGDDRRRVSQSRRTPDSA